MKERRAHPRYLVTIDATLVAPGSRRPCEIRDICTGGMFVVYSPEGRGAITVGSAIAVQFSLNRGGTPGSASLFGRVVRATADSAGVAFVRPDAATLKAVLDLARAQAPTGPERPAAPSEELTAQIDPFRRSSLIDQCHRLILGDLEALLPGAMHTVAQRLSDAYLDAQSLTEQRDYLGAIERLKRSNTEVLSAFRDALLKRWHSTTGLGPDPAPAWENISRSDLALVDDESLENWLVVSDIANTVRERCKEELVGLERRLSVVLGAWINGETDPYDPRLVAEAFQDAIQILGWPPSVNRVSYIAFRDVLADRAAELYGRLNTFLVDQHILPSLSLYGLIERSPTAPASRHQATERHGSDRDGPYHPGNQPPPPTGSATPPPASSDPPAVRKPDLYEVVGNLQGPRRRPEAQRHTWPNPADFPPGPAAQEPDVYDKSEILGALAAIQATESDVHSPGRSQGVRSRILQTLFADSSGRPRKQVNARDDNIIAVAENVFRAMLDDPVVSNSVKGWLKRLELPLTRLAVEDSALFVDDSHIARQVINKIAELEFYDQSEWSGHSAIRSTVDGIIDQIIQAPGGKTEVFASALDQLNQLIGIQDRAYADNLVETIQTCQTNPPDPEPSFSEAEWNDETRARWTKRVDRLQEGDLVVFKDGLGEPTRTRLAWVSGDRRTFVFANLLGQRERTLDRAALAALLFTGNASPMPEANGPALDRAQYAMLESLHSRLRHESTHDPLTGLINRHEFENALTRALTTAKRDGRRHVFSFVDIDNFGAINATCGYSAGDQLLKRIAKLIRKESDDKGVLARLGNDEFGLLLEDVLLDDVLDLAENQIQAATNLRFDCEAYPMSVGLSIGLAPVNARSENVARIWQAAESSARLAKDVGGSRIQVYHTGHARLSHQDALGKWVSKIDHLLEQNLLFLRCQRIAPIQDNGRHQPRFEILLGIRDETGDLHSPKDFIEAAEWYHRMPVIDHWVVRNTLEWMSGHPDLVARVDGFAINLSGQSLMEEKFADFIVAEIARTRVPSEKVCFEVTETVGISSLSDAAEFIQQIKDTGCKFSLDDFGSGMSSYAYLKNLPVDILKIDGAFVRDMNVNNTDYAVVKSVCEIGHFMSKKVVAEYVENNTILTLVREIGVDYAQGYFIEEPILLDRLTLI